METLAVLIFAIVTLFQLATCLQANCGEAQLVQISDETRNVSRQHFPWAGALYSVVNKTITGEVRYICGASLISDRFSVTASHCIQDKFSDGYRRSPSHIIVYFGIYDLRHRNSTGFEIEEIFLNDDWSSIDESYDADISLLKLRNAVTFSTIISPICLWPPPSSSSSSKLAKGTIISWTDPSEDDPGYWNHEHDPIHNYPQQFVMPIRSNTECLLMQPRFKKLSSERTFCAGGLNSGQCLEVGNSGASMAVEVDGKFYLNGIVSASFIDIAGCDNITFTLFTDALSFKSWIMEHIDL